jgi:hypothetical protein
VQQQKLRAKDAEALSAAMDAPEFEAELAALPADDREAT